MSRTKYDWDRWFAAPRTELRRGADYRVPTSSMMQMLRNQATRRGLKVKFVDRGDVLVMWVRAATGEGATA